MDKTNPSASSLFAALVQRAAAADDAFDDYCVHCYRVTRWRFTAWLAGRKIYRCARCGCEKAGRG